METFHKGKRERRWYRILHAEVEYLWPLKTSSKVIKELEFSLAKERRGLTGETNFTIVGRGCHNKLRAASQVPKQASDTLRVVFDLTSIMMSRPRIARCLRSL